LELLDPAEDAELRLPGPAPRAALFDFNGTISLDEPILDRLFQEVFAQIGVELTSDEYYAHLAGLSDPEIVVTGLELHGRAAEPALCAELLRAKIDRYKRVVLAEPTVPAAVADAVRAVAARVPVAIGSGAVREEIVHVLDQHALRDLFGVLVTIDDVTHGKPDPETYLRCLDGLRATHPALEPADCVVFEDSRFGIAAAHAAGMRCVAVRTSGDRASLAAAELVVQGLTRELAVGLFGTEGA
jgi:beta-phosphoglucomutase-like phosphatase (HAD superfamily)